MNNILFLILLPVAFICLYFSRPKKPDLFIYDPTGDESLEFLMDKLSQNNLSIHSGNRIVRIILKRIIKKLDKN